MKTPIVDFVNEYIANDTMRMHMPGHKGVKHLGAEAHDITEIRGADVLYHAEGIIAESEANAASIFGTAKTVYSTEGSSLCIRAMLMLVTMLARSKGRQHAVIAAGRNAHKTFITAAGLTDVDVRWMYANGTGTCGEIDTTAGMKTDIGTKACKCADTAGWEIGVGTKASECTDTTDSDTSISVKNCECRGRDRDRDTNTNTVTVTGAEAGIVTCRLSAQDIEAHIVSCNPDAVYITSPDYLGNMADISAIAKVCHRYGCLLLVDNAHGAYLAVRERQEAFAWHPIALGADLCCDSAHKTLPVLTGGAYLHISHQTPKLCIDAAEQAMSMFATTSPSYLIMQSLDLANKLLAEEFTTKLAVLEARIDKLKQELVSAGWKLTGDESIKLTIAPKSYGYTGDKLADILREHNIEPEFSDPDYLVLMPSTDTADEDMAKLHDVLMSIKPRQAITVKAPILKPGHAAMSIRDALFAASESVLIEQACGRILAEPGVTCPPAVPIAVCGEIIDDNAIACFKYYGIETVKVVNTSTASCFPS